VNTRTWLLQGVVVLVCASVCGSAARAANLPLPRGEARTPETRTLTAQEATQTLENDWLFQAMGEPLPSVRMAALAAPGLPQQPTLWIVQL
jgi:hypothetical protein